VLTAGAKCFAAPRKNPRRRARHRVIGGENAWPAICTTAASGGTVMKRFALALVVGTVAVVGTRVDAHHSMAEYLTGQTVVIRGEVVTFEYRNPHSFIHVLVTEPDGTRARYVAEWSGSSQLKGQITSTTLKPGDELVISGYPARSADDRRVRLLSVERPKDGFAWKHRKGDFLG
jgi:hypothetical protein